MAKKENKMLLPSAVFEAKLFALFTVNWGSNPFSYIAVA
jgi:hypothetical protein